MPNIKSAKKRVKVIETKTLRNKMIKSALKTYMKKFDVTAANGDKAAADAAFKLAVKKIDQAVSKGVIKKNTASRKKSSLSKLYNTVNA